MDAPEGALPEGATMQAKWVDIAKKKNAEVQAVIEETVAKKTDAQIAQVQAVDITFRDADGNEVEPQKKVTVTFTSPQIAAEGTNQLLVHVESDREAQERAERAGQDAYQIEGSVIKPLTSKQLKKRDLADEADELVFDASQFSVYAVAYTVDFHYDVDGKTYDLTLQGGDAINLRELLAGLRVFEAKEADLFMGEVKSVEFSNTDLVAVAHVGESITAGELRERFGLEAQYSAEVTDEQIAAMDAKRFEPGDWALLSLKPFDSEETLTITMANGDVLTIYVTDAQIKKTIISDKGDTYEITVTYGEDAQIPDGAELRVTEITETDNAYEDNCTKADKALQAKYDRGLLDQTAVFDISIVYEGREIEPAEGSVVLVDIRLQDSVLSDEEESSDQKTDAAEVDSALGEVNAEGAGADAADYVAIYNGMVYGLTEEIALNDIDVVHVQDDGKAEIVDLSEKPVIDGGEIGLQFETDSFSTYIVTGSTSNGENYTVNGLPNTIYVGDTINLFWTQYSITYNLNGNATEKSWEDRYNISGRNYSKGVVIEATRTGSITVGGKTITIQPKPEGSHPATVSTVPNAEIGVTMNMFDYDLNSTLDDYFNQFNLMRQPFESTFKDAGVNKNKTLKFWGSGINKDWYGGDARSQVNIDWNKNTYTENDPGTGIVKGTLSNGTTGYPVLTGGNEDLAYLFTDSHYNNDVRAYMGVDGLFQKDDQDYYYYDSSKNYAWLNPTTKVFEVYGGTYHQWSKGEVASQFIPGQYDSNGNPVVVGDNGRPIGFFPFHEWNPDHDKFVNWDKALNHHFGLNMEVKFSFPSGSMAPVDKYGNPIVFEFNGDDDMWVFIDGKLAMDIGGIHQPIDGKIDFTNRTVTVAVQNQTGYTSWDSLFDGEQHTLQVFYMERGGCDSNCKIKFNLSQYADIELDKVDGEEPSKLLVGAKFQLFKEVQKIVDGETVTELEPVYWYKKRNSNDTTGVKTEYVAEADENGHVKFEGVPLGDYILKEIAPPPDYKPLTDVRNVRVYLDHEGGTAVVKYSISGDDANANMDGVQIANEKIEPVDISLEKRWDDNGNTTPPAGASATFKLMRVGNRSPVTVRLVDKNGALLSEVGGVFVGDTVKVHDSGNDSSKAFKFKTNKPANGWYWTGETRTVNENDNVLKPNSSSSWSLETNTTYYWTYLINGYGWHESESTSTSNVSYAINQGDVNNGVVTLALNKHVGSDFVSNKLPQLYISNRAGGTEQQELVEVETFTLPDDGDNGSWKKTFDDLPSADAQGNPYKYYFEEVSHTPSEYNTTTFVDNNGNAVNPLTEGGDVVVVNSTPEKPKITAQKQWVNPATGQTVELQNPENYQVKLTLYKGNAAATASDTTNEITQTVDGNGTATWLLENGTTASDYTVRETAVKLPWTNDFVDVTSTNVYGGDVTSVTDTTFVVTNQLKSEIDLSKVDQDTPSKSLEGARFYLIRGNETATDYQVTSKAAGSASISLDADSCFTVPAEGVHIAGLAPGSYQLKEKEAPAGYIITSDGWTFTVNTDGTVTDGGDVVDGYTFTIPNEPGAELPAAGGLGNGITNILGAMFISTVVFTNLLLRRRELGFVMASDSSRRRTRDQRSPHRRDGQR